MLFKLLIRQLNISGMWKVSRKSGFKDLSTISLARGSLVSSRINDDHHRFLPVLGYQVFGNLKTLKPVDDYTICTNESYASWLFLKKHTWLLSY